MSGTPTLEVPGYQVIQFLGSGARSTIWQIKDCQSGKLYALKRVVRRSSADGRFLEQAVNEYQVSTNLEHSGIRHILQLRRVRRWFTLREIHLVMELCEGETLQEKRPQTVLDTVRIFGQVAGALAYMNAKGFVHADMKPNNILVSPRGVVKIIDLGQSCALGAVKQRIQGTPDFIAPEQVYRRPLDARTDVFNFGAALYWTLAGKPIPTVLPKGNSLTMVADLSVTPLEQINPGVPAPLSKLVTDCIQIHPQNRPKTMNEVGSRLELIAHTLVRNARKAAQPQAEDA